MTFQPSKIVGKKIQMMILTLTLLKSCLRQEYNLVDAQLNKAYGEAYRYIEQVPRTGGTHTEDLLAKNHSEPGWILGTKNVN